jgi:pimeloyl-ACP methyl ester carboxylesterase
MEILHSKIIGEGAPLIILHGYFGMSDNWKSLGNRFSENFQTHIIDQRNHGRSFHSTNFSYEYLVEDLVNYVEHHNLKNIIVLGHSMGGKTAMLFAVKYPTLVAKLIIVDIAPKYYQPHHYDILKALNSVDFSIQNTRKLVDEKISELIFDPVTRAFLLKNVFWKEKGVLGYRFNLQALTKNNEEVGKALPSFTFFHNKTLFLAGGNSHYIKKKDIPLIKKHFPDVSIQTIPNVGHWLHAESPEIFYELVMNFLKKN